jgi:hypothetical protein
MCGGRDKSVIADFMQSRELAMTVEVMPGIGVNRPHSMYKYNVKIGRPP